MSPLTPQSVKAALWSYNIDSLEIQKDKKTIIFQILNFGTEDAIKWLFKQYTLEDIEKISNMIPQFQWNKKSLALWKTLFTINPYPRTI